MSVTILVAVTATVDGYESGPDIGFTFICIAFPSAIFFTAVLLVPRSSNAITFTVYAMSFSKFEQSTVFANLSLFFIITYELSCSVTFLM